MVIQVRSTGTNALNKLLMFVHPIALGEAAKFKRLDIVKVSVLIIKQLTGHL